MVSLNCYPRSHFLPLVVAFILLHYQGASKSDWLEVQVSNLLPKSTCTGKKGPSGLTVFHRHGPCSPLGNSQKPNHAYILKQDKIHVESLNKRNVKTFSEDDIQGSQVVQIPDIAGGTLETGNYVVNVGFGTPKSNLPVVFDTESDVSWIQCLPCTRCYKQQDPLFNPKNSATYSAVSCNSSQCQQLDSESRVCPTSTSNCGYKVKYGDKSSTQGNMGLDTLTLGSDSIPNFFFGCGKNNKGLASLTAGLLGLGRGSVSLISQLPSKYGKVFSYCLPSKTSSTGYLTIGGGAAPNAKYTSMAYNENYPSFYFINLVAITVAGETLEISPTIFSAPGTIVDSGTVITRLPPTAYTILRDTFKKQLIKKHSFPPARRLDILDTCYDMTGYEKELVSLPRITLVFSDETIIDVDYTGLLYVADISQACLAFAPNHKDDELVIIGNVQQRTYNVIYDVPNKRIGFAGNACP